MAPWHRFHSGNETTLVFHCFLVIPVTGTVKAQMIFTRTFHRLLPVEQVLSLSFCMIIILLFLFCLVVHYFILHIFSSISLFFVFPSQLFVFRCFVTHRTVITTVL